MGIITKPYTFASGNIADGTKVNANFDTLYTQVNAATGTISAAGLALIDDATSTEQIATLGLDADIATLALPANTTISAAGAELINDANATAQLATLGAVATGDSRLSDARPASDVSPWAKAATPPAFIAPPMTTAERDAIASPTAGMIIFNTTTHVLNFYYTSWISISSWTAA